MNKVQKSIIAVILLAMIVLKPTKFSFKKNTANEILKKYANDESKNNTAQIIFKRLQSNNVDTVIETNYLLFSTYSISNKSISVHGLGILGNVYFSLCEIILTDSDGDNIPDDIDKCPLIGGTKVNNGCPDSDGDGVIDELDDCPNEYGKNSNGCNWSYKNIKIQSKDSIHTWYYAIAKEYEGVFSSSGWYTLKPGETNYFTTTGDELYIYRYFWEYSEKREWVGDYEFCVTSTAFKFDNPKSENCNNKAKFRRYTVNGKEELVQW